MTWLVARIAGDGGNGDTVIAHVDTVAQRQPMTTTGGHGGRRGCGEVTAIRLVMVDQPRDHRKTPARPYRRTRSADRRAHRQAGLSLPAKEKARKERIGALIAALEKRLYP